MTDFLSKFEKYKTPLPHGLRLPKIDIEEKYYKMLGEHSSISNFEFLKKLCWKGIKERGIDKLKNKQEYYDRLKYELDVFEELGFVDYILLNWDILNFCRESEIPTGRARGSSAGSLVLYSIFVTDLDPIKNGLFFERFVSKARARKFEVDGVSYLDGSLAPDVDNDIGYYERQAVISYINNKYKGRTSQILTLNTLSSKLCIKECGKIVSECQEQDMTVVSSYVEKVFGKVESITKTLESSKEFQNWEKNNKNAVKIARRIEGLAKNFGIHASGIAIAHEKIEDIMPLQRTKDGGLISGYDMHWVAEYAVKFDILGLRTLSVVRECCNILGIKEDDIDYESEEIYSFLQDLNYPTGLFQIEADCNYRVCQQVKPKNLLELSDVLALARPGALAFVSDYIDVKEGRKTIPERHEVLDKILLKQKGFFLYQESLMQTCHQVFGLSLEDAEAIRRACGKKIKKKMKVWEPRIYEQAEKLGLDKELADFYWKALIDSADYSFNLSHAVSYASLCATTVYLKFKHPKEFFVSLLRMCKYEPDPHHEVHKICRELPHFGINLLPPDLERSDIDFTIEGNDIRYGLSMVKGVSAKSIQALKEFRDSEKPNKYDIFLTAKEAGINIGILSSLIQAGAMPNYKQKRSRIALEAQSFNLLTDREKRNFIALGPKYEYDLLKCIKDVISLNMIADDGRLIMKPSRFETFSKKYLRYKEIYEKNSKYERFANWYFETKLLGYAISTKLIDVFDDSFDDSEKFKEMGQKAFGKFVGVVEDVHKGKSRNGNKYIKIALKDEVGGFLSMMVDSDRNPKCTEYLNSGKKVPEKDDVVVISGNKSNDILFISNLDIMTAKIFMKLSELKD